MRAGTHEDVEAREDFGAVEQVGVEWVREWWVWYCGWCGLKGAALLAGAGGEVALCSVFRGIFLIFLILS